MKGSSVRVAIEPVAVTFDVAGEMLGIGRTKAWQLAREGRIQTVKIGADRKVVVASIRRFVEQLAAAEAAA